MSKMHFDQRSLLNIAKRYDTEVTVQDCLADVCVYDGPLSEDLFDMISTFKKEGLLNDCRWNRTGVVRRRKSTVLYAEAVRKDRTVVMAMILRVYGDVDLDKAAAPKEGLAAFRSLLVGFVLGLFSWETVLKICGITWMMDRERGK